MAIELLTNAIAYDIRREAGGVEFSGSLSISLFDSIVYNTGDNASIYVGNVFLGDAIMREKKRDASSVSYTFSSVDSKYLKRFVVDGVGFDSIYNYYVDVGSFELHWLADTETATANVNKWVILKHRFLKPDSEVVTSSDGSTTYVKGTDYNVDYENGRIYILGSGNIADGSSIEVSYSYYEGIDVVDLVKYIIDKYVGLPYVVDDFEILDENNERVRLTKYTINDYIIDALKKLANVVGARIYVTASKIYFLTESYDEVSTIYDNSFVVFDKWKNNPDKIVNDIHVFGKEFSNDQLDTFAGDGTKTGFFLSKIPSRVNKVEINIDGEWTEVPYKDPNTGEMRYKWSVDYEKGLIKFSEPPPISPSVSDPVLQDYPEWSYMNKITIANPNSSDVALVGKIIIDNTDSNAVNDFKWDAVKEDGSDIVIATVDQNGNTLEIPYKFFYWDYGNKAEIWFGGTMSNGNTFTVPANGSVEVYLLYGNPNATRSYTWNDVGVYVYVDTTGEFIDIDYAEMLYIDTTSTGGENSDAEFSYDSVSDSYRAYSYVTGYDDITAEVDAYTDLMNGEFRIKCKAYLDPFADEYELSTSIYKENSSGDTTWHKSRLFGTSEIIDNGLNTYWTEYAVYANNERFGVHSKARKYTTNGSVSATAYVAIKYWVLRPDGADACTYSIDSVVENLYNNIKVSYYYMAPLYYNLQHNGSISTYGIKSVNVTLNWVADREALKSYAQKYIDTFANPLHIGKIRMAIGSFVKYPFTIGNIINVVDRHNDVSGKFLVDKVRISNGIVEADVIKLPDNNTGVIGLLHGTVLFDVDQSARLRTLEVGKYSTIINVT